MILNPSELVESGHVKFPQEWDPTHVGSCLGTPNGIDFTIDHLYSYNNVSPRLSESNKIKPNLTQVSPVNSIWTLQPNTLYDGMSDIYVTVPKKTCALLINRSTANRFGLHLNSGLYDDSFKGHIGFTLFNRLTVPVDVEVGVRIGQIVFMSADSSGEYVGKYNHDPGTHWMG